MMLLLMMSNDYQARRVNRAAKREHLAGSLTNASAAVSERWTIETQADVLLVNRCSIPAFVFPFLLCCVRGIWHRGERFQIRVCRPDNEDFESHMHGGC